MPKLNTKEAEHFVKSRINSFQASFHGLTYVIKTQKNAWIHLAATVLVVLLSYWLKIDRMEWVAILLVIGLVWMAEFMNTALEVMVDLASPEIHPLARISKDVGAASVLISALIALITGLLILGPALLAKINNLV